MSADREAAIEAFVTGIVAARQAAGSTAGVVLGVGWATVELDRAEAEFGGGFTIAPGSVALGAACRVRGSLLLIEPSTEGLLAATLARHGEGPVAVWFDGAGTSDGSGVPREARSKAAQGPFGLERLVIGGSSFGPHVLLVVAAPGTIPP